MVMVSVQFIFSNVFHCSREGNPRHTRRYVVHHRWHVDRCLCLCTHIGQCCDHVERSRYVAKDASRKGITSDIIIHHVLYHWDCFFPWIDERSRGLYVVQTISERIEISGERLLRTEVLRTCLQWRWHPWIDVGAPSRGEFMLQWILTWISRFNCNQYVYLIAHMFHPNWFIPVGDVT